MNLVRVHCLNSLSINPFKGLTTKPALLEDLDVTASLELQIWSYRKTNIYKSLWLLLGSTLDEMHQEH